MALPEPAEMTPTGSWRAWSQSGRDKSPLIISCRTPSPEMTTRASNALRSTLCAISTACLAYSVSRKSTKGKEKKKSALAAVHFFSTLRISFSSLFGRLLAHCSVTSRPECSNMGLTMVSLIVLARPTPPFGLTRKRIRRCFGNTTTKKKKKEKLRSGKIIPLNLL